MEAVSPTPPTLDQVARAAGVSRATASRVLNGSTAVSEEARRAVEKAAAELGYVLNRTVRNLAVGRSESAARSDSVGVVLPEPSSGFLADRKFSRLLAGIAEQLAAHNLQMVVFAPQSPADVSRLEQYLAGGHVDAVLLLAFGDSDHLHSAVRVRGIPVVFGGRPSEGEGASFVEVDNRAGGRLATQHLIDQGRRHIAHLAAMSRALEPAERYDGFRDATWQAGLRPDLVEFSNADRDGGEMAMSRLLARTTKIDAVFAATDEMAVGALWALQVVGRRVPDDVAIIGFDDSPLAMATKPALSSVRQPIEEMGREMTRAVISLASNAAPNPRRVTLRPELTLRESTLASTV